MKAQVTTSEISRYLGCLLGLACGDAVGTTVEFRNRGSFNKVTDMVGGGPFELEAGQWTDDTSMALCLAHSLVFQRAFNPTDLMNRFCNWANYGYMSSTGECFDIGATVREALLKYQATGDPFAGSTDPRSAGNGGIMRLAPVPMFYALDLDQTVHYSAESSRTTHATEEAIECARLFGAQLRATLLGWSKKDVISGAGYTTMMDKVRLIAAGNYENKTESDIRGSGYVVESLEAALWCFLKSDSYQETVLMATNLGDDADTTAAIAGQLAGAYYGVEAIPASWLGKLTMRDEISALAEQLLELRQSSL